MLGDNRISYLHDAQVRQDLFRTLTLPHADACTRCTAVRTCTPDHARLYESGRVARCQRQSEQRDEIVAAAAKAVFGHNAPFPTR